MTWDGKERRQRSEEDHDLLIEIHTYSKSMIESFKTHVATDMEEFKNINRKISGIEKWMYGCIGGLAVLQVILAFVK
jgi:hypothetical protein